MKTQNTNKPEKIEAQHTPGPWQRFSASKPKKGDEIQYKGVVVGRVHHVDESLCWVEYLDGRDTVPFIWAFKDGLNDLHNWPNKDKSLSTGSHCPYCYGDYPPACHCVAEAIASSGGRV